MGRKRSTGDKPYRLAVYKDRPIAVIFDFIPGKRISTGHYDLPGAVEWAENFIANNGIIRKAAVPTFGDFAKNYFIRTDKDSIREKDRIFGRIYENAHYEKSQGFLDNYIMPEFGRYLVTAITARMIELWLPYIKSIRKGSELSNDGKNKILTVMRVIFDDIKKSGYRDDNPAENVKSMTYHSKEREALSQAALNILMPSDIDKRIEVWGNIMWATYFSIFYDTGLRPGEIAALRVCDIWQTKKGLAVATSRSVNRNERKVVDRVKTSGKGYKERTGLLYDDTAELLIKYINDSGLKDEDMLFKAPRSKYGVIYSETANKHFKETLKKYGLYHEGFVQYCLRHTYTTERRGDMSDDLLAVSMGHTKLRNDYDHQNAQDLIRRLDKERDAFFENRKRLEEEDEVIPFRKKG